MGSQNASRVRSADEKTCRRKGSSARRRTGAGDGYMLHRGIDAPGKRPRLGLSHACYAYLALENH
jgi:hypothetical protein